MKSLVNALVVAGALLAAPFVMAEEAVSPEQVAPAPAVVEVSVTGEQVVTVNSGNETVDAAANYAVKCAEKAGAMRVCDGMGAFKAIACRKLAEVRYKSVDCPIQ